MNGKIYVGQIGVQFTIETQAPESELVDWNTSNQLELRLRLPNGSGSVWIPTLTGNSELVYITGSKEDLPMAGTYLLQARVVGSNYDALGETASFTVFAPFK